MRIAVVSDTHLRRCCRGGSSTSAPGPTSSSTATSSRPRCSSSCRPTARRGRGGAPLGLRRRRPREPAARARRRCAGRAGSGWCTTPGAATPRRPPRAALQDAAVVFGHSHVPVVADEGGVLLVKPGGHQPTARSASTDDGRGSRSLTAVWRPRSSTCPPPRRDRRGVTPPTACGNSDPGAPVIPYQREAAANAPPLMGAVPHTAPRWGLVISLGFRRM